MEKSCMICEKAFEVPAWRTKAVTCSRKCRDALIAKRYDENRVELVCRGCGGKFKVPPCHAGRRHYCSKKCAAPSRNDPKTHPRGEDHYGWRGGKYLHADGYRYIAVKNHPLSATASYVFEHRVVVEDWMNELAPDHHFIMEIDGRKFLKPEIVVHHINEIKSDNRRRNLLACTRAAHLDIHDGKAPMSGEVWPEIDGLIPFTPRNVSRNCQACGAYFRAKRSVVGKGGAKYCSRKCYNERDRTAFKVNFVSD